MKTTIAAMLLLMTCAKQPTPAASSSSTTAPPAPVTSGPRITMPDGTVYALEVVADQESRAQGLMYRDHLRPNTGMLFIFAEDGEYAFWMKNTLIPLDMLWISADQKLVHIKHDVQPCKVEDCPSYPPGVDARYVLELAAGEGKKHNLKAGDKLVIAGIEGFAVN